MCDIISLFSWRSRGPPAFIYTSVCTALPFQRRGNSSLPPLSSVLSLCLSLTLFTLSILCLKLSHVTLQVLRIRHNRMSFWLPPEKKASFSWTGGLKVKLLSWNSTYWSCFIFKVVRPARFWQAKMFHKCILFMLLVQNDADWSNGSLYRMIMTLACYLACHY